MSFFPFLVEKSLEQLSSEIQSKLLKRNKKLSKKLWVTMSRSRFEALFSCVPRYFETTKNLVEKMSFKPPFDLEQITGIRSRRMCQGPKEDSFSLALKSAEGAITCSRYSASDLDMLISCSICRTKEPEKNQWEPSFALQICEAIGARKASYFDLSNACAGMMTGVMIADRMIKSGMIKTALVVSGEHITPVSLTAVQEIDNPLDSQFASLTVGDAGACVILDQAEDDLDYIDYIDLITCAEYSHLCIGKPSEISGGPALYTNNREMHKEDRIKIWPLFQKDFLDRTNRDFVSEKYDYLIHHQVGIQAMAKFSNYAEPIFESKMPPNLSVVEKYANTSSTSHFVVLDDVLKQKTLKKEAKILFVPAASGLVTGFLSAKISNLGV